MLIQAFMYKYKEGFRLFGFGLDLVCFFYCATCFFLLAIYHEYHFQTISRDRSCSLPCSFFRPFSLNFTLGVKKLTVLCFPHNNNCYTIQFSNTSICFLICNLYTCTHMCIYIVRRFQRAFL